MRRSNAFLIALLLGAAVVTGSVATLKTVRLGTSAAQSSVSPRVLAHRRAVLARAEASLRKALARRPPKLPPIPKYAPVKAQPPAAASPPTSSAVQYVRPSPIVVVQHRAGGDDEGDRGGEHETEHGDD